MKSFATLAGRSRAEILEEAAQRLHSVPVIVEKDFWVCWLLERIFGTHHFGAKVVFKGGTSLSKVFGVIDRFSEDIDLCLPPSLLGAEERDLDEVPNPTQRAKRMKRLQEDCARAVEREFRAELEASVRGRLGDPKGRASWLEYRFDAATGSPLILFDYPGAVARTGGYIAQQVKVEIGSLTDQRPTGRHVVEALIARAAPGAFDDLRAEVMALEIERTFWEKATILHAEHHRPADKPMRDRFARHYADFAALWRHPAGRRAAAQLDLLARVRLHKQRFFASAWASYETAVPGSLRLAPPESRRDELARDYRAMAPMFLTSPLPFGEVSDTLREAEQELNGG